MIAKNIIVKAEAHLFQLDNILKKICLPKPPGLLNNRLRMNARDLRKNARMLIHLLDPVLKRLPHRITLNHKDLVFLSCWIIHIFFNFQHQQIYLIFMSWAQLGQPPLISIIVAVAHSIFTQLTDLLFFCVPAVSDTLGKQRGKVKLLAR